MKEYVCVIGGANIDISSTSFNTLILHDSNPSKTTLSLGGVARNISENLARLGINVEFITALGNDVYAEKIRRSCDELGINLTNSVIVDAATSTYLCVNDEKGDMYIAASDMEILNSLDKSFLNSKLNVLNNAKAVVVDTNLSTDTLDFIFKKCKAPIFVETVSANKTKKLLNLGGTYTIKPNIYEAELLSGIKIQSDFDLKKAAQAIYHRGYQKVVITLGERGAFYYDEQSFGIVNKKKAKVINTTGAGDSFFSALIWADINGYDLKTACDFGNKAAALTLGCSETVNPSLTVDKLTK